MPSSGDPPAPWSQDHGQFLALAVRVVEAAPNAMIVVDHRGRIVFTNARTEILFGYERQELFDRPIEVLVPRPLRSRHRGLRAQYGWSPEMRPMGLSRRVVGLRRDGTEVALEVGLSPLTVAGETMVLTSISDMTDHTELERRHANLESALEGLRRSLAGLAEGADEAVAAFDRAVAGVSQPASAAAAASSPAPTPATSPGSTPHNT